MSLRNCHLWLGGAGLVLFLLTGQYMTRVVGVPDLSEVERMVYRAGHIYLLLACVANVFAGATMKADTPLDLLQRVCSLLLIVSVALLAWSFFFEVPADELERPVARLALYLLFGAASALLLQCTAHFFTRRKKPPV